MAVFSGFPKSLLATLVLIKNTLCRRVLNLNSRNEVGAMHSGLHLKKAMTTLMWIKIGVVAIGCLIAGWEVWKNEKRKPW